MNPKHYYCGEYTISLIPFGGIFNFHIFCSDDMYLWDLEIASLLGIGIVDYYHMMLFSFNGKREDCRDGDTLIAFQSIEEFEKNVLPWLESLLVAKTMQNTTIKF